MSDPPSEGPRYESRFHVSTERSAPAARRRGGAGSVLRMIILTVLPVSLLGSYIFFSTLNMRGEYERDRLRAELKQIQIERQDLEAQLGSQRAPSRISQKARALGMEPAGRREFARVPAPKDTGPVR